LISKNTKEREKRRGLPRTRHEGIQGEWRV